MTSANAKQSRRMMTVSAIQKQKNDDSFLVQYKSRRMTTLSAVQKQKNYDCEFSQSKIMTTVTAMGTEA